MKRKPKNQFICYSRHSRYANAFDVRVTIEEPIYIHIHTKWIFAMNLLGSDHEYYMLYALISPINFRNDSDGRFRSHGFIEIY